MFRLISKESLPQFKTMMLIVSLHNSKAEVVQYVGVQKTDTSLQHIVVTEDDGGYWYISESDGKDLAWIELDKLVDEVRSALCIEQ